MGAAALREGVVAGVEAGARGGAGGCGRGVRQGHERASRGGSRWIDVSAGAAMLYVKANRNAPPVTLVIPRSDVAEKPRWALASAFTGSAVAP
jgi:hypothetical protein